MFLDPVQNPPPGAFLALAREINLRGGCAAERVWIAAPKLSGSIQPSLLGQVLEPGLGFGIAASHSLQVGV
jgi:hypothetical protein